MDRFALRQLIQADLFRYYGGSGTKHLLQNLITNPGFRYTFFFRKCGHYHNSTGILSKARFYFYLAFLKHYSYKFGIQISPFTSIGPGLYIEHFGNIVVNRYARLGKNINLHPGITIGATYRGCNQGTPIIGDNVWIGANAVIVGNIKIGDNVIIAPLTYLNSDVPDNAVIAGNPGIIISFRGVEGYINNKI